MRAVVQRANQARVQVGDERVGSIGEGLVAFVGAGKGDTDRDASYVAEKIAGLRVFEDEAGKMSRSVLDVRRGRRPSFDQAMEPLQAERLFNLLVSQIQAAGVQVSTGKFRAMMRVMVDNAGPVTILIDSRKTF